MTKLVRPSLLLAVGSVALGATALVAFALPSGDASRGADLFRQCATCHAVDRGLHLTGPSLAHVWGRRAGTVDGFTRYSQALKDSTLTWTEQTLDRWLQDSQGLIAGNVMTFQGVKDAQQRADLIAYLKALAAGQAPPPRAGGMMGAGARVDLKTLGKERRVKAIRYCGDGYHVTTEAGAILPFWEFNLRFKTDSSPLGPAPGTAVLIQAGMQGDRASIVFATPEEIGRMIARKCS